jgi:hypothetical protein
MGGGWLGSLPPALGHRLVTAAPSSVSPGKLVCKFNFLVGAEKGTGGKLDLKLDPSEHQNYVWAAEEEVKARKVLGDVELKFTTKEQEAVVLEAFRARREDMNADGRG